MGDYTKKMKQALKIADQCCSHFPEARALFKGARLDETLLADGQVEKVTLILKVPTVSCKPLAFVFYAKAISGASVEQIAENFIHAATKIQLAQI